MCHALYLHDGHIVYLNQSLLCIMYGAFESIEFLNFMLRLFLFMKWLCSLEKSA